MSTSEFEPFVDSSNYGKIKLPDFNTIMEEKQVKQKKSFKLIEQKNNIFNKIDQNKKSDKRKFDISDMGIDFEKLKETKGKRGYSIVELNKIVDEINRRKTILIKKNQSKSKIAEIIYNLK